MKGSTPRTRAASLKKALVGLYEDGKGAEKENIIDILSDLRHLCDSLNLNYADCDRIAYGHYVLEA